MPVVAISPHPRYGGEPFEREAEFEPDIERAMVSEDLVGLFGSVEMVSPSPVASVNGQRMKCTGLVDFSVVYVDRSCSVAAWVTPDPQDSIIIGSQTMLDLGLVGMKDGEDAPLEQHVARDDPNHDAVGGTINNPERYVGQDSNKYIPAGFLPLFRRFSGGRDVM